MVTGSSGASPVSPSGTSGSSPGTKHSMSLILPMRSARHRGATRMPVGHLIHAPGVDRVDHRVVGAVELDERERERVVERVLLGGLGHPCPVGDGARGAHLDEVGRQFLARLRIPLEGGCQHLVAVADTEDLAPDERGHEPAEHGSERALVRELDVVLDQPRHVPTPQSVGLAPGCPAAGANLEERSAAEPAVRQLAAARRQPQREARPAGH